MQDLKSRITRYMICISLITMITMMVMAKNFLISLWVFNIWFLMYRQN